MTQLCWYLGAVECCLVAAMVHKGEEKADTAQQRPGCLPTVPRFKRRSVIRASRQWPPGSIAGRDHPAPQAYIAVVQHRALPRCHGPLRFSKGEGKALRSGL